MGQWILLIAACAMMAAVSTRSDAADAAGNGIRIDAGFPGGNVNVISIDGDLVTLLPDMRGTANEWFYWYFRVLGARGRTVTFAFQSKSMMVGAQGPAVSDDDGKTWRWLGATVFGPQEKKDTTFVYKFPSDADTVRFAVSIPYVQSNLDQFLAKHGGNASLRREELCSTEKGRKAELLRVGCIGKPEEAGQFDFVIVGGGLAGVSAAICAARLGPSVALIQDRPVLGGNSSPEVGVRTLLGKSDVGPYLRNADVLNEIDGLRPLKLAAGDPPRGERVLAIVQAEPNIRLFLDTHVFAVEKDGDRVAAVTGKNVRTSREVRFAAPLFADCTGDGTVGYLAGADWRQGREARAETGESLAPEKADERVLGSTNHWRACDTGAPSPFPECPWAIQFTDNTARKATRSDWDWESGMGRDTVAEAELIRDHNFRAIYGNWAFLKNHSTDKAKYENWRLERVNYVTGKRESRRLLGDVILQQQDLVEQRPYPDACVTATWTIDLHYPDPENSTAYPGEEFIAKFDMTHIQPYTFPFRCLYSRNVTNLLMAGRNISVTHVALGSVRVQRTTAMMGAVIGRAAYLCKSHNTTPRGLYEKYLQEFLDLLADPDRAKVAFP